MRSTPFDFEGRTYYLSFTAEALFTVYDKFGITDDILGETQVLEPTGEGWKNCCWLAALMAAQGELQRRHMGYDPQPMLSMERLRTGFMAADSIELRRAVRAALEQGFIREYSSDKAQDEVDLVLLERDAEKKKAAPVASALSGFVEALRSSISPSEKSFY